MKTFSSPPSASALIESMRDIGYSFETALADIIDNSITAKAKSIEILCDADRSEPILGIVDDGIGMTCDELFAAMRPGSQNPLKEREDGDLGRFGLGLKTASFSQCRRLTVISRTGGITSAAQWDLDYVAETDDWLIIVPDDDALAKSPFIETLGKQGTLVIWEKLDRLSDQTSKTSLKDHMFQQLDIARQHIALVFHRFLLKDVRNYSVDLSINGDKVEPFDPFHSAHIATQKQPEERIRVAGANVRVQPFVLPHHKKVTRQEWEKYAGEGGYLKNQGFYVYRAGRLIVHGTWFRLIKQSELTKLARIRVDIPTALDHLWKIDVKKASATPPLVVRQRLKSVIDKIAGASNRVYTQRGHRVTEGTATPVWSRRIDKNEIHYEINRQNPSIAAFGESLDDERERSFSAILYMIEKSFPTDALFSDIANSPVNLADQQVDDHTLTHLIDVTVSFLKESGLGADAIIAHLKGSEPYRSHWEIAEQKIRYKLGGI